MPTKVDITLGTGYIVEATNISRTAVSLKWQDSTLSEPTLNANGEIYRPSVYNNNLARFSGLPPGTTFSVIFRVGTALDTTTGTYTSPAAAIPPDVTTATINLISSFGTNLSGYTYVAYASDITENGVTISWSDARMHSPRLFPKPYVTNSPIYGYGGNHWSSVEKYSTFIGLIPSTEYTIVFDVYGDNLLNRAQFVTPGPTPVVITPFPPNSVMLTDSYTVFIDNLSSNGFTLTLPDTPSVVPSLDYNEGTKIFPTGNNPYIFSGLSANSAYSVRILYSNINGGFLLVTPSESATTQPVTTQPLTTQPVTTQPVTTQPLTTQPLTTQPLTTQPLTTQPLTTQPLTTQPLTTQPLTTQPLTTTTTITTTQPTTTRATLPRTPTPRGPLTLLDGYVINVTNITYNTLKVKFPDATHYKPRLLDGNKYLRCIGKNPYTFSKLRANTEYYIFTGFGDRNDPTFATAKIITPKKIKERIQKAEPMALTGALHARLLFFYGARLK